MRSANEEKTANAAETAEAAGRIYQLKISIAGSKPPIWRRVLVEAHTTLGDLHYVIQALMGWYDGHLHQFETPGAGETSLKTRTSRRNSIRYMPMTDPLGEPFDWDLDGDEDKSLDENEAHLDAVAPQVKAHFLYTYDMGDGWEHDIQVEKILPAAPGGVYPICVDGEQSGPIEDSGGIWGYEELLEILADPSHEEHRERKTWLREAFGIRKWDANAFDLAAINKKLKKLQPKPKRVARWAPSVEPDV